MKTKLLFLITSFFFLIIMAGCSDYGEKVVFGNLTIYYTSGITKAEASDFGSYLIKSDFDNRKEKTIQLVKSGGTYQVKMVVNEGVEENPQYERLFRDVATEMSRDCFNNAQVELHACNGGFKTLRVFPMRSYYEEK